MSGEDVKELERKGKEMFLGFLVFLILAGVVIYAGWPKDDGKTREQRARELQEWTEKRNRDDLVRRSNEIIYDEMTRQSVGAE